MSLRFALVLLALTPLTLRSQTAADSNAIRQTALDYIEGYYDGDGARDARARGS